ncbi:MAG: hypothetical protein KY428_02930, partial [Bacteroidetes bacterium]|nr:hypothetical protein [Bacteroidota bacterium]
MKPTRFDRSILLKADDVAVDGITGELKVGLTSQELHVYLNSALRTVATLDQTQTFTNKSIDADTNTISNLEVDNLKAGVLDTDLTSVSAIDDTIPSAKAVKTYVDSKHDAQDQASEISYSNTTSGLAATTAQAAIDEVDANSDAHIASTAAHGATGAVVGTTNTQTLSNKTLDNSSVITVKDANLTIQDDVDATKQVKIQASGLTTGTTRTFSAPDADGTLVLDTNTQTVTNKTIVAASNTITTAASGNLAATELNAALSELQSDIDTRTTTTTFNAHLSDTADAHDASAISTTAIAGVAGGVASDVQAVSADLKSQIDTNSTNLTNHLNDTADAHDASAISTTAIAGVAGGVASEVQAVVADLKTQIDTKASTTALNDHLADTTDAHDASAISVVASGNLAATEVQAALDEHQADIDSINSAKVSGPASATDNAVPRYDSTTGKLIQNSGVIVSDTNVMSGLAGLTTSGDLNSTGKLVVTGITQEGTATDGSTTGANVTLSTPSNGILRLTNASLSSIDMISGGATGQSLTIINHTGSSITVNDNTGATLASRILTGTKAALTVEDEASIHLKYDATESRWMVIGGSGSAAAATSSGVGGVDILFSQTFDDAALGDFTQTGLVLETTSPLHGTTSAKLIHDATVNQSFKEVITVDEKFRGESMTMAFNIKSGASADNVTVNIYDETNSANIVASESITLATTEARQTVSFTIPSTCASLSYTFTALPEAGSPVTIIDDVIATISVYSLLETSVKVPVAVINEYSAVLNGTTGAKVTESKSGWITSTTDNAVGDLIIDYSGLNLTVIPVVQVTADWAGGTKEGGIISVTTTQARVSSNSGGTLSDPDYYHVTLMKQGADYKDPTTSTETKTIALTQSGIIQEADSYLRITGFTPALATTNTYILHINGTTQDSGGDAFTFNNSSTEGTSIVINKDGLYRFSYVADTDGDSGVGVGFSKNSTSLSTTFTDIPASEKLGASFDEGSGSINSTFTEAYLKVGDVVRPHSHALSFNLGSSAWSHFSVTHQGSLKQVNVNTNSKITIPTSELRFEGASARGTTATAIVKFDTQAKIRGDAFEVVNTAADGTYVKIKKAGKLDVSTSLVGSAGQTLWITKNQSDLTGTPTASESLAASSPNAAGYAETLAWNGDVAVNDIIRVSGNAAPAAAAHANTFNLYLQEQDIQVSVSNTLPQFSESDIVVKGAGNTGQSLTADVTDVPFTAATDTNSAWDGSKFTVPEDGIYDFSGSIWITAAATARIKMYIDGTVYKNINTLVNDTVFPFAIREKFTKGQVLSIRFSSSSTLNNDTTLHYLNITKVGKPNVTGVDVTPFVNIPQPLTQSSFLSLTQTLSAANISGALSQNSSTGIYSYDSATGVYTALKKASIDI